MTVASLRQPAEAEMRRPYAPPSNVIAVLKRARIRNLPERITNDFLNLAGVPSGMESRAAFALTFLGLMEDDGRPTAALRSIAAAGEAEYREQLAQVIRSAYSADFDRVDPSADDHATIMDAFARYQPRSQTNRMVMTFLGLCREAGIEVLDAPRVREVQVADRRSGSRVRSRKKAPTPADSTSPITETRASQPTASARDPLSASHSGQSPPLFGVTESDIAALDDAEFAEVWAALGKVARARARSLSGTTDRAGVEEAGQM